MCRSFATRVVVPYCILADAQFWDDQGFNVDIPSLKKEVPDLRDLRTFLREYKASGGQYLQS